MQIDENTIIGDILAADSGCEEVFLPHGMACMGCPGAPGETVAEACEIHGIPLAPLLEQLQRRFAKK